MKQESKIKRIYQAFTEGADISEEAIQKRRDICSTCPFNSNVSTDMTLLQKQKKALLSENNPFCTACGCQINEKTSRGSEACGLEEKGRTPKWNRINLKTVGENELDVENLSPNIANISINYLKDGFKVQFTENIVIGQPIVFKLKIDRDFGFNVYCSCLSETKKLENNVLQIQINTNGFSEGELLKTVEVLYKNHANKITMNKITLKGNIVNGKL